MTRTPRACSFSIAVVDNHDVVRDGVLSLLGTIDAVTSAGAYNEVGPVLALASAPDIVVLDLYLGRDDRSSVHAIGLLTSRGTRVVVHTAEERPVPLRSAVAAGASGVALKNDGSAALLDVIARVARNEFVCSSTVASALVDDPTLAARLTPREVEVLQNLDDGLTQHQVGRRLGISEDTVKTHLRSIRGKYIVLGREITNTGSVVREASRDGWMDV